MFALRVGIPPCVEQAYESKMAYLKSTIWIRTNCETGFRAQNDVLCNTIWTRTSFASKVSHNIPPAMAAQLGDVQLVLPAAALELKNHPPSKAKGDRSEVAKLARTEVGGIGVGWLVLGGFRRCWYW